MITELPRVSVIVPCRNEEGYIAKCLDSILDTDYPADRLEVLVADGRSDDGTRAIVERYARHRPVVRLLDNPKRIAAAAINACIRAASGEVVVRMDAHTVYSRGYLRRVVTALLESGADNVGGVIVTLPAAETPVARAIAVGLAHPLGVGNAHFRIGVGAPRWVDTVAFFCCRRSVFDRVGMFDEDIGCNEDDEFNGRLIARGGRVLLLPDAVSYYYGRRTLAMLGRMYHRYGYYKPRVARKLGRVMTVRQLVPSAFVLGLGLTAALALAWPPGGVLFAGLVAAYGAVLAGCAIKAAGRHGGRCGVALAAVLPVLHFSYGIGFLRGLVELATGIDQRRDAAATITR